MLSMQQSLEQFRIADEVGFDWVTVAEHHFAPFSLTPNPLIMAGALTQVVKRAKIALLGANVPILNPVRVAEEMAMLATAAARGLQAFALVAQGQEADVALRAAAAKPEAIHTLVLLSPRGRAPDSATIDDALTACRSAVQAQVLALFGTNSAIAPPAAGAAYKRALPACHLIYVYDADDTACERLEAVSEVVLDFLRRRDAFLVSDKDGRVNA